MDLATYYTTLKTLWNDLDGANCVKTYIKCDCCKATEQQADHAQVIKFLAGLNESYSVIRSQIIMKNHVLVLSEMYNLVDQDHFQRNISLVQNAVAFIVVASAPMQASVNATSNNFKGQNIICSHCGYTGHTVDKCYKIHGYLIGFKHEHKNETDKSSSSENSLFPANQSLLNFPSQTLLQMTYLQEW